MCNKYKGSLESNLHLALNKKNLHRKKIFYYIHLKTTAFGQGNLLMLYKRLKIMKQNGVPFL